VGGVMEDWSWQGSQWIARLLIELKGVSPTISRIVEVDSTLDCWELHELIQHAFGWQNSHLHRYHPGLHQPFDQRSEWLGKSEEVSLVICDTDSDYLDEVWWQEMLDEHDITVGQLLAMGRGVATYVYDFGDNWNHTITVLDAIEPTEWTPRCRVVESQGPSPVEDSGGPAGLTTLLRSLGDSSKKSHRDSWDQVRFMNHPGMRGYDFQHKSVTVGPMEWGADNEELYRRFGNLAPEVSGRVLFWEDGEDGELE
jgi:hypothetical protein